MARSALRVPRHLPPGVRGGTGLAAPGHGDPRAAAALRHLESGPLPGEQQCLWLAAIPLHGRGVGVLSGAARGPGPSGAVGRAGGRHPHGWRGVAGRRQLRRHLHRPHHRRRPYRHGDLADGANPHPGAPDKCPVVRHHDWATSAGVVPAHAAPVDHRREQSAADGAHPGTVLSVGTRAGAALSARPPSRAGTGRPRGVHGRRRSHDGTVRGSCRRCL